jgi:hypothetical protein
MLWVMRVSEFLAADHAALVHRLAHDDALRFRHNEAQQLRALRTSIACLRDALVDWEAAKDWHVILEYPMLRLNRRIDAILVSSRAVLVLEFKVGKDRFELDDQRQVEDYALDFQDFHSLSSWHPIVPILIATEASAGPITWPLPIAGATTVLNASSTSLPALPRDLWLRLPESSPALNTAAWEMAPYRPVPGIIDAACTLYSHHGVADIATARADARNLSATTQAILQNVHEAQSAKCRSVLFVTGIPGAGKTLCGLNAVFGTGRDTGATFLTGNPTLVHVLREALARDAAESDRTRLRAARQRTKAAIQALPSFRDYYIKQEIAPPERVIVIDEAQRAWSAKHAVRKGRDREVQLWDSEPGHLLDIMVRQADWSVIICLVGGGQEIHDGEGGLAEWGAALAKRPAWRVQAAPSALQSPDERQRLPNLSGLTSRPELHLDVPVRSIRNSAAAPWVDAVLLGDVERARHLAKEEGPMPFLLTRDLSVMRARLRQSARGLRRCGLVGSSGAKRLRADGLGAELPHMDADAVAHWFLDRWPDVRASDALEVVATEFSCQGLELDHVGVCWGSDLVRMPGRRSWLAQDFAGTKWNMPRTAETIANRINTYRVLLTRARYETVIWVPRGDRDDITRNPAILDAIADFLLECRAQPLVTAPATLADAPQALLL